MIYMSYHDSRYLYIYIFTYTHIRVYIYIHIYNQKPQQIDSNRSNHPAFRTMAALWSLRPTAVDACVNLQAQRLFVSRFRNNMNFAPAVLVMSFEQLGDCCLKTKQVVLNVLLDHFGLVRVWFWESHHLWEGGLQQWLQWIRFSDCLYICLYIYNIYETTVTYVFLELYAHYILLIFLASLPCKANVDSWIFHLPAGRCTFLKVLWWPPVIAGFSIYFGKNKDNKKALLWSAKGMWSNRSIDQVLQ